MKQITKYQAIDGKEFLSEKDCEKHELELQIIDMFRSYTECSDDSYSLLEQIIENKELFLKLFQNYPP
jgi:hypothetical protein